jgi:predicted metal-dependent phosphoesterase TrpH
MSYRADLHCHTSHSFDCQTPVRQQIQAAKKAGLSALAITDHDQVSAIPEAQALGKKMGIQIIPGVEITTEGGTHIVALFINEYPTDLNIHQVIDFIHAKGGVSALPHLFRSDTGLFYNHTEKGQFSAQEIDEIMTKIDLIEINNFKSQLRGEDSPLDIIKKYNKPLLSNTDSHYSFEIGKSYTSFEVDGELTPEILLTANRKLAYYPVPLKSKPKKQIPLAHYQPSVSSVSKLKKVIPPAIVTGIGKGFYRWQQYGRRIEKSRQLDTILAGLTLQEFTPEEALKNAS